MLRAVFSRLSTGKHITITYKGFYTRNFLGMWKQFDKEELEKQYTCRLWCQRMCPDKIIDDYKKVANEGSELARSKYPLGERDIKYGSTDNEYYDIFAPQENFQGLPIFVFIHGGYWQNNSRKECHYVAPRLVDAGAIAAVIGYDLCPSVTVPVILEEVKKAVSDIMKMAARNKSRGIYICGHSVGAHMASTMLSVDWDKEYDVQSDLIKGVILVSGVFDAEPLVHTFVNDALQLTENLAKEISPQNFVDKILENFKDKCVASVLVGDHESPEFKRQSKEFYQSLLDGGMKVKYTEVPGSEHFNIMTSIQEKDSTITKETFEMMQLKSL